MTDLEWARAYCAEHGWRYLSHEVYRTGASYRICIAVEQDGARFEVKLSK